MVVRGAVPPSQEDRQESLPQGARSSAGAVRGVVRAVVLLFQEAHLG